MNDRLTACHPPGKAASEGRRRGNGGQKGKREGRGQGPST